MKRSRSILLSFDVEEFDLPLEHGIAIRNEEQLHIGHQGLIETMDVIDATNVVATFFTTANFASHFPDDIRKISNRHEIASHTFYHSKFSTVDLSSSKALLENVTGKEVKGLRMPRMQPVNMKDVSDAGYRYDSSVNPTWIPGRYNNTKLPRTVYSEENIVRLPASVTPNFRIPLFWLSFKNFPYAVYRSMVLRTLRKDGYVCLYFHPWEFTSLAEWKVPMFTKKHAGKVLKERLRKLIGELKNEGEFTTINSFLEENPTHFTRTSRTRDTSRLAGSNFRV